MNPIIELGAGSYGRILYDPYKPNEVAKIHYLSTEEIEYGEKVCTELFRKEFDSHVLLYNTSINLHLEIKIPRPIQYEYITRNNIHFRSLSNNSDSCVYFMEKMEYPETKTIQQIISPEHQERFYKTNPIIHPPPYLLLSAIGDSSLQPGRIHLTDLQGVHHEYSLYYSIIDKQVYQLAEIMMKSFFSLTIHCNFILQDIEYVLTTRNMIPTVGMFDFNQIIEMDKRESIAKPRIPDYTREYDIANTYLFLSGIDTGFLLTDRNTQWKFLPIPSILPDVFFNVIYHLPIENKIVIHICSTLLDLEMNYLSTERKMKIKKREKEFTELWEALKVWHEITVYGFYDTEILDMIEPPIEYQEVDSVQIMRDMKRYCHFCPIKNIENIEIVGEFDYYRIISPGNQHYISRFERKQKCGLISDDWLKSKHPVVYFDIAFQRLFIIRYLFNHIETMRDTYIRQIIKLIRMNANFKYIMNWIKSIVKIKGNNVYKRRYTLSSKSISRKPIARKRKHAESINSNIR